MNEVIKEKTICPLWSGIDSTCHPEATGSQVSDFIPQGGGGLFSQHLEGKASW